tara:strand:+ start:539 stop:1270 length:732 start_codon:yes stop_codon:yes gene_type:complete
MILKMSKGNMKLPKDTLILSISAGITCPGSNNCKAWVTLKDDKRVLNRGNESLFTCFAASEELRYPNVFKSRKYNYDLINSYVIKKDLKGLTDLINRSIQANRKNITKVRIHESGDFYNRLYLEAWKNVAELNKDLIFYCYSKSLLFFPSNRSIPNNFYMTASYGGKYDYLIDRGYFKRFSKVVFSEDEATKLGLSIDKDDSHCYEDKGKNGFALLLHGMQEKNTPSAEALKLIKRKKKLVSA